MPLSTALTQPQHVPLGGPYRAGGDLCFGLAAPEAHHRSEEAPAREGCGGAGGSRGEAVGNAAVYKACLANRRD